MPDSIKKFQIGFTQVPNWVLTANDISLKAKGLYCYLFSKPDGWQFHFSIIEQETKESKGQILSIIKELINAGYITRHQYNENGRFGGMIYEFIDKSHIRKEPCTEKSAYGHTPSHNNNNNINNTDISNNTDSIEKNIVINNYIKKETKRKDFLPPTLQECVAYAKSMNCWVDLGERFYEWYTERDWKDTNGRKVKNWKLLNHFLK